MPDAAPWFRVGHVTHTADRTGCTVILFDRLTPTVVDVRGGAPGTRETDLLSAGRLLGRANAILLAGGSAFGLAAADGVMRALRERDQGFPTSAGSVPIVPGAVIFDLAIGSARAPTAEDGYAAVEQAAVVTDTAGQIGAGAGATVAKLGGVPLSGGLGIASVTAGAAHVTAVIVLNAVGDVRDPDTVAWLARAHDPADPSSTGRDLALLTIAQPRLGENTSIGAVLVSHALDRDGLLRCCIAAHDALARCVIPAHTIFDGDTFFASCPTTAEATPRDILALAVATEIAVERAIVSIFSNGPRSS